MKPKREVVHACSICQAGENCGGHVNMRDARLNHPGAPQTPGFERKGISPAPYGYITDRMRVRAQRREAQQEAIARKEARKSSEKEGARAVIHSSHY